MQMRSPFAPEFNFVVKHPFTFNGREYGPGEDFDKTNVDPRLLRMLFEQHKLDSIIPSIIIAAPASKPKAPAKPATPPKKAEAKKPAPKPATAKKGAPEAPRFTAKNNFHKVEIKDGEKVIKTVDTPAEAQAALAELNGSES